MLDFLEKTKEEFEANAQKELSYDEEKYLLEEGELISIKPIQEYSEIVEGIAIIGDPHTWSKRPGRRLDESFTQTVLGKLEEIAAYCNENNLMPLMLGDLFERADDNDLAFLNQLIQVLKKFKLPIVSAEGNHDKTEIRLTERNALSLLETAGLISVMKDNGFAYSVNLKCNEGVKKVLLGSTPYGLTIPDNVFNLTKHLPDFAKKGRKGKIIFPLTEEEKEKIKKQEETNKTSGNVPIYKENKFTAKEYEAVAEFKQQHGIEEILWITHHDLAMNGAYPNSIPLKEILGVDRVFNGHIHSCKESVKLKNTVYYNKGNITRLKIDQINDKPAIWIYKLDDEQVEPTIDGFTVKALNPFYLTIKDGREVFKIKHSNKDDEITSEEIKLMTSIEEKEKVFVDMLSQKEHDQKTDDGALIEESLNNFLEDENASEQLKELIVDLFNRSISGKE